MDISTRLEVEFPKPTNTLTRLLLTEPKGGLPKSSYDQENDLELDFHQQPIYFKENDRRRSCLVRAGLGVYQRDPKPSVNKETSAKTMTWRPSRSIIWFPFNSISRPYSS